MGTWSYAYNALGELIRQTDAKGQVTTLFYDKLGRLTQRSEPNLVSNWYFDKDDSNASCGKSVGKLCVAKTDGGYRRTLAYDGLGRPYSLTATIDAVYTVTTAYVASGANLGKVDTVTYPTGFAVKHVYNATGYLSEVRKLDDNSLLWRANSRTAAGQILNETLGNGLSTATTYDALNRPTQIVSGATGNTVQDMSFGYDLAGNLVSRIDAVQAISESFQYDSLNRLKESTGLNLATNTALATRRVDYDALGNIISKSDVGSYVYPVAGAARPHAVSYITGARAANYSYDANGNLTGVQYANGNSRTLTYASFGLPTRVEGTVASGPSYRYDYSYNAEHERVKLVTTRTDGVFTSIYLHPAGKGQLLYEKEIQPTKVEHKHYVQAGGELIGVFVTKSVYAAGDGPQMRYYHRDHLGSIVAITNPSGAVLERLAYEAFGQRRFPDGTADPGNTLFGVTTDRGYTGHEHLDELALIHMNGRIYDPVIGRFMTADPILQAPDNLQSYNRYSYVMNNPFGYIDPTGYSRWTKFRDKVLKPAVAIAASVVASGFVPQLSGMIYASLAQGATVAQAGAIWAASQAAAAVTLGAASGAVGGAIMSGSVEGALKGDLIGGLTAGAFFGVGEIAPSGLGNIAGRTAVGCAAAAIQGGDCRRGATQSFLTAVAEAGWEYARKATDQTKLLACSQPGAILCVTDQHGLRTDGARDVDWKFNPQQQGNALTRGGMALEGSGQHWYDPGQWLASETLAGAVNAVSKVHDLFNSWNYSSNTGWWLSRGEVFDSLFQIYSFGGMPVAAAFTLVAKDPGYVQWSLDNRRRRGD